MENDEKKEDVNKDEMEVVSNEDIKDNDGKEGLDEGDIIVDKEEGDIQKIIKKNKEKLKVCMDERQQYLDGWQRARADFMNLKKAGETAMAELEPMIKQKMFNQIFPVIDNFEMAFANKEAWEKVDRNWRIGVESIYGSLLRVLNDNGFEQIGAVGDKFDPEKYQPVQAIDTDEKEKDDTVAEVIQKGYKFKNRVVRASRVEVFNYKINK